MTRLRERENVADPLKRTGRLLRKERGAAIMEFAVVVPLLLVTTIGLVDFGRAAFEAIEVENAAHAGASYGARSKGLAADTAGIKAAAIADMGDEVDSSKVTIESERYCECDDGSNVDCDKDCGGVLPLIFVRVHVEKQFETLLKYPGLDGDIDLQREVSLRVR